ncbi:hypothetical protein QAD02_009104 [Eretmocerus hayati]|uniref:Uncharacterized protein n=1 Tax=Eretmocerus hayati TaxID=131215 RepID=A0ACC2N957_9HYME|nr:hypothetical protein QAD02_009104 [Eretmocerus hayati]
MTSLLFESSELSSLFPKCRPKLDQQHRSATIAVDGIGDGFNTGGIQSGSSNNNNSIRQNKLKSSRQLSFVGGPDENHQIQTSGLESSEISTERDMIDLERDTSDR